MWALGFEVKPLSEIFFVLRRGGEGSSPDVHDCIIVDPVPVRSAPLPGLCKNRFYARSSTYWFLNFPHATSNHFLTPYIEYVDGIYKVSYRIFSCWGGELNPKPEGIGISLKVFVCIEESCL